MIGKRTGLAEDEAVIGFDDWNSGELASKGMGERRALEEFLAANPDLRAEELRSYSENAKVFLVSRTRDR